jgi:hypothetical protein
MINCLHITDHANSRTASPAQSNLSLRLKHETLISKHHWLVYWNTARSRAGLESNNGYLRGTEKGRRQRQGSTVCRMLSSGLFPVVCSLNANISEHCLFHLYIAGYFSSQTFHIHIAVTSCLLAYEDGTDRVFRNADI